MSVGYGVHSLLKQIKDNIDGNSDNFEKDVNNLLLICNGPQRKEFGLPFTKVLNSQELLVALLSLKKCREFLKDKPEFSVEITDALFKLIDRPWDIIYSLVKNIIDSNYNIKKEFIKKTWSEKGSLDMPFELALLLIERETSLVENHFLEVYQCMKSITDVWKESANNCFIRWSIESPQVFYILVSVLNEFLIHAKKKTVILKLIADLITNIISHCEKNEKNILFLYPLEYQSLVSSLILEPEINPCKACAISGLQNLQKNNPKVVLMLLSHFPLWVDALKEKEKETVKKILS